MRYAAAALLALVTACSAPTSRGTPIGSSAVPLRALTVAPCPELRDVTAWAVAEWSEAGAAVSLAPAGIPVRLAQPEGGNLGMHRRGVDIEIDPSLTGDRLAMTVLHELGHALLGAEHHPGTVMKPAWDGTAVLCVDASIAPNGVGTCEIQGGGN